MWFTSVGMWAMRPLVGLGFYLLLTMRKTIALSLFLAAVVNGVETPNNCPNAACEYVENLAATCQDQPSELQSSTENPCLCTERWKVNLSRCLSGVVCEWDGISSSTTQVCPDIYCPGTFEQDFIDQCPGFSPINTVTEDPNTAPTTGTPGPRPINQTTTTSVNPGQHTSSSSSLSSSGASSSTVNGTVTTTRTDTESPATNTPSSASPQLQVVHVAGGILLAAGTSILLG